MSLDSRVRSVNDVVPADDEFSITITYSVVRIEGAYGSFHLWINVWAAGKTVRFLITPERFRDKS